MDDPLQLFFMTLKFVPILQTFFCRPCNCKMYDPRLFVAWIIWYWSNLLWSLWSFQLGKSIVCMPCTTKKSSLLKVSKFQNESIKSSHCPKYERKIWKILSWILRTEFFKFFRSYFGQCDDFIFSFWNLLTFRNNLSIIWISLLLSNSLRPLSKNLKAVWGKNETKLHGFATKKWLLVG